MSKRTLFFMCVSVVFLLTINGAAFAAIDATLSAPASVGVSSNFDVKVNLAGTDKVGSSTLRVTFPSASVTVTAVTSAITGMVVPTDMTIVNTNGEVVLSFSALAGIIPGTLLDWAVISCTSKTTEGAVAFDFNTTSTIKGVAPPIPVANLKGTLTGASVNVTATTTTTVAVTTTTAAVTTTTAAVTTTTAAVTTTTGAVTTTTGGVTTTTIACTTRIPGDIGGNCGISVFDALQVAKHDVALITLTAEELGRADVDGVTGVDIFDALKIAEMATSDSTTAK